MIYTIHYNPYLLQSGPLCSSQVHPLSERCHFNSSPPCKPFDSLPLKRQVGEASLRNKLSEPWAFWSHCLKPHCNLNIHIVTVAHALFVPQSALSIYTALPFLCPLPRHQLSFPVCSCVFPVWLCAPLVYFGSQLLFPFSFAIWTLFIWTSYISQIKGLTLLFLSALVSAFASSCLTPLQTEMWKKERSVVLI